MGAMAPVSLAAALAQQNAEALFGVVLAQLVRPGTPVMYGAFTSNVDMRSGAPAFGTPENAKANIASGQLARRYRLPYRTSNASASNAADAQGAYETEMSLWGAILGHGNLVYHAAGWQEGGLTASFEKLVLDVEMLQMMIEFLKPIVVNEQELGFDAIKGVPTGGHFFGEPHTMERYEHAFYRPLVSNWQNYENWQIAGGKDATQRATQICGSKRSRNTRSRRWIPPSAKRSTPMSQSAAPTSAAASPEGNRRACCTPHGFGSQSPPAECHAASKVIDSQEHVHHSAKYRRTDTRDAMGLPWLDAAPRSSHGAHAQPLLAADPAASPAQPEFGGQCAEGLAEGRHVMTNCTSPGPTRTARLYCFSNEAAKKAFLKNPERESAEGARFHRREQRRVDREGHAVLRQRRCRGAGQGTHRPRAKANNGVFPFEDPLNGEQLKLAFDDIDFTRTIDGYGFFPGREIPRRGRCAEELPDRFLGRAGAAAQLQGAGDPHLQGTAAERRQLDD